MKKADLHLHSRVSDGSFTIAELAEEAARRGLDAIAVTDHDTLSHLRQIPAGLPVQVAGGIEISAMDPESGKKAHILGFSDGGNLAIKFLNRNGYRVDPDALQKADGKYIYKQHIMEYLVKTGQAPDMFGAFYQRVFKNGGICAFDITYLDPFEAVRVIREAGGLAVLAHSGQQKNFPLIPRLFSCGLNGLELNHPSHSEQDRAVIRSFAEEYGLFLTGGSDFHGEYEPEAPGIGSFLAEESGVRAVCSE